MEIILALMVLWIVGLGYALIVGRRRGAATYLGWSRDAALGVLERLGQLAVLPIRWSWTKHREGFLGFWIGVIVTILSILLFWQ